MRHAPPLADLRRPRRQQPVAGHREEDARLAVLEDQQHRGQRNHRAERDDPARRLQPGDVERLGQRIRRTQLGVRHEPGRHDADDHVDHRADREPAENPDRQVALRIACLFGGRRDRVEADVGEEHDRRALMDASPAVRCERHVVRRIDMHRADDDEEAEHEELDHDHDVVGTRALLDAEQEDPRDHHHDRERRDVDENRDAGEPRRGVHQRLHRRIGTERDRTVAVRQPPWQIDADAGEQRIEVTAPRDGDRDVADGVLEDEIPADDPRDQLAERGVRVRIRTARLRNHRRELRVAERGQRAHRAEQNEGQDQRRPCRRAHDLPIGPHFTGRRGADRREDPGADHRADGQHHQIAGAQHALQRMAIVDRAEARRWVCGRRAATCASELHHVEAVGGLVRRHGDLAVRAERDADKAAARRHQLRFAVEIGQPVQSTATGQRIDHVQDAFVRRERQTLRPAERREQRANAALPIDAIDVIVQTPASAR